MKTLKPSYLKGKKILEVNQANINQWVLHLDDGTSVVIDAVPAGLGLYVPNMWLESGNGK